MPIATIKRISLPTMVAESLNFVAKVPTLVHDLQRKRRSQLFGTLLEQRDAFIEGILGLLSDCSAVDGGKRTLDVDTHRQGVSRVDRRLGK